MIQKRCRAVISIIQRRLTDYRVPFFEGLRTRLAGSGIRLRLLHGVGTQEEARKSDNGTLDWAEPLATKYFAGGRMCWQPFASRVAGDDLVIITQENGLLANHLALCQPPSRHLAFWGHGGNFQGARSSLRERYKIWSTRRVDWYFAYTQASVDLVVAAGFPPQRTTCLNNAIDTEALARDVSNLAADDLARARATFGLGSGPVGLHLGSLYHHKRLDFLLSAAEKVHARLPGFQLLIVGDGPDRCQIETAAKTNEWIKFAGSQKGSGKAAALKLATIVMNPGAIGLGILDSFAAGVPMITTDCGLHGPEIAYLNADNGVMTANDIDSYTEACLHQLLNDSERSALVAGCRDAAFRYTLPNMVENFATGVMQALELQP